MLKLWIATVVFLAGFMAAANCHAADVRKAYLGWDLEDGQHVPGILYNEGVRLPHDLGHQNDPHDSGNFKGGKNCGGTTLGWACADLPQGYKVKNLTVDQALHLYDITVWAYLGGDDNASQYDAYLWADLGTNIGKEEMSILLRQFINRHNGHLPDEKIKAAPLTHGEIAWLNAYTKSDIMPLDHTPRYPGDYLAGEHDSTRRQLMVSEIVNLGIKRYETVAKSPKRRAYLWGWLARVLANAR